MGTAESRFLRRSNRYSAFEALRDENVAESDVLLRPGVISPVECWCRCSAVTAESVVPSCRRQSDPQVRQRFRKVHCTLPWGSGVPFVRDTTRTLG